MALKNSIMPLKLFKLKKALEKNSFFSKMYGNLHLFKTKMVERRVMKELQYIDTLSEKEIFHLQNKKLKKMLTYAYENTVYYKKTFDKHNVNPNNLDDLRKIPFLNKKIIKEEVNDLISKQYDIKYLGVRNTGGSTGQPMEFYADTKSGLLNNGHHAYVYSLMGHEKDDIVLSCGGIDIPEHMRSENIFWLTNNKGNVFGDYRFSVLYLTEQNIETYVNKLIEIKPAILRGYPSFFADLANYIIANNIKLDFKVKGANLTSEMCSHEQREVIEKAFSTMVYFEYGHNEISLYCYTKDKTYTYQSSPIYGYIEVLNEDGTETEIGEVGNIVTTGFNNHGMPFIRYQTGDLGELSYRKGGVVRLKTIYGRSQDFIISKERQKIYLTALIFGQHMRAFANIAKWQIVQNSIGTIEIKIIKGNNYSTDDEKEILDKIKRVSDLDISFDYVKSIPITGRGKHLFFVQNIK